MTRLADEVADSALTKIQFHQINGSSIQRAEYAYLNFLAILEVAKEEDRRYQELDSRMWEVTKDLNGDVNDPDIMRLINEQQWARSRLESLIRAVYEAATVVIGILSAEAQRDESKIDWSLKGFAKGNPALLAKVDEGAVVNAWSVTEYRNKLISHHDFCRMYGFKGGKGNSRMFPMGMDFLSGATDISDLEAPDGAKMEELWQAYSKKTTAPAEININNRRKLLFLAIPPVQNGSFNSDRKAIDDLVEKYGIESATLSEIEAAIRGFVLALADVL